MVRRSFGSLFRSTKSPYDNLSESDILDKFKTETWSKISEKERIDYIQALENKKAVEQNRLPARVKLEEDEGLDGGYEASSNIIYINAKYDERNSGYNMLDSYYHESRHAQQAEAVRQGEGLDDITRDICHVEDTYGNYDEDEPGYSMNTSEMDSNTYAANKMLEHKQRFKDDPAYQRYLDDRQKHFSTVNDNCYYQKDERANRQIEKIERSYYFGDINKDKRNELKDFFESDNVEPVEKESMEVETKLLQARQEGLSDRTKATGLIGKKVNFNSDDTDDDSDGEGETGDASASLEREISREEKHTKFFEESSSTGKKVVNEEKHEAFFNNSQKFTDSKSSSTFEKKDNVDEVENEMSM